MKYAIYNRNTKGWFLQPGRGETPHQREAHRYTKEEAERELAHYYNAGCEMEPMGESQTQSAAGTSEEGGP